MGRWVAVVTAVAALGAALAGCAAIRRDQDKANETMLGAAGFKMVQADTPARKATLAQLPPRTVRPVSRDGKSYYVYTDPDTCGTCLWVGGQKEFQEYQRLKLERHIDEENLAASEADEDAAELSWETWGPWFWF
jgi:hypothetical protein